MFRLLLLGEDDPERIEFSAARRWRADAIHMANRDAEVLLERDPTLATPRGQAVRLLLALFGKAEAMMTLRAG